ncbi:MAG: ABC transporter permease, partial [Gemmatimonadaceae bacterium]
PVPHPEELVLVTLSDQDRDGYFSNPLWEQVRDRQTGFSAIAAFGETEWNIADGGEARTVQGLYVSGDYFRMFAVQPALGRFFAGNDDTRGCAATAVLGHGFWRREYGGRTDIIGKTISLVGQPFEIVGVVAPGFGGPEVGREAQVYAPLCAEAQVNGSSSTLDQRSNWWLRVMGRRDENLSLAQAIARLKALAPEAYTATVPADWPDEYKTEYRARTLSALPAAGGLSIVRRQYSTALKILMGAVALVLLIACANVANLLLARAEARQREVAIRLAIGAGRGRLVRQLLTESTVLALLGAAGGLLLGHWGTRGLVALISTADRVVTLDLGLNARVLGFTMLVATITATIFGLAPAWRGTRVSPQSAMKANARGVTQGGSRRFAVGRALVAVQVALSLTLLVGAGLLMGSLYKLRTLDPGFRADGVLLARTSLLRTSFSAEQRPAVWRGLVERIEAMPGVASASASTMTPIGRSTWNDILKVDGFTPSSIEDALAWFNAVSPGYFETMGTSLVAGRDFDATDVPGAPKVAIVNVSAARHFFGAESPLGKQFRLESGGPHTVVGVVEDAKYASLRETSSHTVYVPSSQSASPGSGQTLEIRAASGGDPRALVPAVKAAIAETHRLATVEFSTLSGQLAGSLQRDRMMAFLSGLFGATALLLSMLGLYGVTAYTVARRRNEIGVRIALGAATTRVVRMVLGDVARVVTLGAALGLAGALAAGKLVASFLYGVEPREPVVLASATVALVLVALAAGLVPALRAARVDPVTALREE